MYIVVCAWSRAVFEGATQRLQEAVTAALAEAERQGRPVTVDDLLLGVLGAGPGVARRCLEDLHVTADAVLANLDRVGSKDASAFEAQEALGAANRARVELGDRHLGTEHLLLGLTERPAGRQGWGWERYGLDPAVVRAAVLRRLRRPVAEASGAVTLALEAFGLDPDQAILGIFRTPGPQAPPPAQGER